MKKTLMKTTCALLLFPALCAAQIKISGGSGGYVKIGASNGVTLTTTGTSGAATLSGSILNIPVYQGAITLTTSGTSGAATLTGSSLNIPQYAGVSVTGYGAKCDGSTDDTAAIQAALNSGATEIALPSEVTCIIASTVTLPKGMAQSINMNESTLKYTGTGTALYQASDSTSANATTFDGFGTLLLTSGPSVLGIDSTNPNCQGQDLLGSLNIQWTGNAGTAIRLDDACSEAIMSESYIYGTVTGPGSIDFSNSEIVGQVVASGYLHLSNVGIPKGGTDIPYTAGNCLICLTSDALGTNKGYASLYMVNIGVGTGGWDSPIPSGFTGINVPANWGDIQGGVQAYVAAGGSAITGCSNVSGSLTVNQSDGTVQNCGVINGTSATFSGSVSSSQMVNGGGAHGVDASYYGVKADGVTDNSTAMLNAIVAACASPYSNGRDVVLPVGAPIVWASTIVIPNGCQHLQIEGPGSYVPVGSSGAQGVAFLSYTGNGAAFQLGTQATKYQANITAASRTGNVESITYSTNTWTQGLVVGNTIMVQGLVPSDLNTPANGGVATITGNSGNVITFSSTGSDETASSTAGATVDVGWDYPYYGGSISGFTLRNLAIGCNSSVTTPLANSNAYESQQSYATGSYAIQSWRQGRITTDNVTISNCQYGIWGIENDLAQLNGLSLFNNHVGVYLGPRSDQAQFSRLYSSGNDTAVETDAAWDALISQWTSDSDGSPSTAPLVITSNYARGGGAQFLCHHCWIEDQNLTSTGGTFAQIGVNSPNSIKDVVFRDPIFVTSGSGLASFATLGNADSFLADHPEGQPTTNISLTNWLVFTGSTQYFDVETIEGRSHLPANLNNSTNPNPPAFSDVQLRSGSMTLNMDAPTVNGGRPGAPTFVLGTGSNISEMACLSGTACRTGWVWDAVLGIGGPAAASGKNVGFIGNVGANEVAIGGVTGTSFVPFTTISSSSIASASTISPTGAGIYHVTGTTQINTITAPVNCSSNLGCEIVLVPDGAWSTGTSGNIAAATTAVVGKRLTLTYDPATSKWYPSY